MIIKQRKVNKPDRFTSRFSTGARKHREYMASIATTAAVQFVLFCFLMAASYQSFVMMRDKVTNVLWYIKYAVPLFFALVALFVLKALVGNIRRAHALSRSRRSQPGP